VETERASTIPESLYTLQGIIVKALIVEYGVADVPVKGYPDER
jgi:hypothetical protein